MKYGHPLDIAEAVLRPITAEEVEHGQSCRQCGSTMGNDEPGVLEPTAFCHICAQDALVILAEHAQGKYIDRQLDRLTTDTRNKALVTPPSRGRRRK